jgi:chitinase
MTAPTRTRPGDWLRNALLACALAAVGSSCGGDGSGGEAPPPPPPPPANAVAAAGADQETTRGFAVTLDGTGSSDPDGDALTYAWTQVAGPDVTGGAGTVVGATPAFLAPQEVSTLVFELRVDDGNGASRR